MQIRADMIQQDAAALAAAFHIGWSIQGAQGAAIARGAAQSSPPEYRMHAESEEGGSRGGAGGDPPSLPPCLLPSPHQARDLKGNLPQNKQSFVEKKSNL